MRCEWCGKDDEVTSNHGACWSKKLELDLAQRERMNQMVRADRDVQKRVWEEERNRRALAVLSLPDEVYQKHHG